MLLVRCLDEVGLLPHFERLFGSIRKSCKGLPIQVIFNQVFCFLLDGTSRHLTTFDELRSDSAYAEAIETPVDEMASSHQIKRFLAGFTFVHIWLSRRLLQQLFQWRLQRDEPEVIVLGMDMMVQNNSEADKRHGVEPTYKEGVKGFHPLQITSGRVIIDAVFRGGSKHSNHGESSIKTLGYLIQKTRSRYRDVPIIVRMDAGFFDQKIMDSLEALGAGYLIGGKTYQNVCEQVDSAPKACWKRFGHSNQDAWAFQALLDKR